MRRLIVFMVVLMLACASLAYAGSQLGPTRSPGPAPNSGNGIPDGSGFDDEDGTSILGIVSGIFLGPGPAPNSGDGVPDGSGFEVPPNGAK